MRLAAGTSYPSAPSGSTVDVGLAIVAPNQVVRVAATVEGKNIRIVSWHWADSVGTTIGAVNKGCSSRQGCSEIKRAGTAFDLATPPITIQPLRGRIHFTTAAGVREVGPGELLHAGPGLRHAVASTEGAVFLLTMVTTPS